jgi:hypothetical protein
MLQTNNTKDIDEGISWLTEHNEDFKRRYKKFDLGQYCLSSF